jgi:hypothetical protein
VGHAERLRNIQIVCGVPQKELLLAKSSSGRWMPNFV